jgi:hypothetical protein
MKNFPVLFFLFIASQGNSQYYYKDIIGALETNLQLQRLVNAGVQSVSLTSFDADGSFTEGFFVQQTITANPLTLKTITRSGTGEDLTESVLISFFDTRLRLIKTTDSSLRVISHSTYEYNEQGDILKIITRSLDSAGNVLMQEEHEWVYKETHRPVKMIRRKNLLLMDETVFIYDNSGNIIEEQTMKNGRMTGNLYYYYNDKNQMTDIVRYNDRAQRLLPDYMFEYSPAGQVIQKITVPGNNSEYFIWRYQYDARGLKIKEACFDKAKKLIGRIEYQYTFSQ